ncbi:MAG: transposase [Pseudonocardiaceae bacterium]
MGTGREHRVPYHDAAQNRIWLALAALAADLLAFTARLALPPTAATYEPTRLRLRILAVAGQIVTTGRQHLLKIDPSWPWAEVITTAHARLLALPVP